MIKNKVIFESSQNKYLSLWLSFVILRISNEEIKLKFREIERISLKIVNLSCHLSFNETCFNNSLLPTYTNIYTCIYVYIHTHAHKHIYIDLTSIKFSYGGGKVSGRKTHASFH